VSVVCGMTYGAQFQCKHVMETEHWLTCYLFRFDWPARENAVLVTVLITTLGDFTFWLSLWLRPKAELKLNLRAQLWSQPGLKFWLSPWAEQKFVYVSRASILCWIVDRILAYWNILYIAYDLQSAIMNTFFTILAIFRQ